MADKMRREKSRVPQGWWKLAWFYGALEIGVDERETTDWPALFGLFERWERAAPSSITARVVHASTLVNYAWKARGSAYANEVSREGLRLFEQRLGQARALLESDPVLKKCPGYYATMMTIALGQGWRRSDYDRLFAEAVALAPDYETFYFRKAYFLQEKWYGTSPDEWHRFALSAAAATEKEHGQSFYTRIVWSIHGPGMSRVTEFKQAGVDWLRMRDGFGDIAREYPDSLWNKNAFCFYAFAADDKATARRLFDELAGRYAVDIWGSPAAFSRVAQWAKEAVPKR